MVALEQKVKLNVPLLRLEEINCPQITFIG